MGVKLVEDGYRYNRLGTLKTVQRVLVSLYAVSLHADSKK
ncbi:Hypothetical protein LOCK919_0397 [Lacticaseibacillus paracasei]|nr:Hypothetical protein LOCK919_0397 [Lacticaseibacillus paracasei]